MIKIESYEKDINDHNIDVKLIDETKLNAKERRRLKRQLNNAIPTSDEVPDSNNETTSTQTANSIDGIPLSETIQDETQMEMSAPLNAKARRKLARQQKALESNSTPVVEQSSVNIPSNLNAKQRRQLLRRQHREIKTNATAPTISTSTNSPTNTIENITGKKRKQYPKSEKDGEPSKSIHRTLFLGQLPYNATVDIIKEHFKEAGDIQVRMLTDRKTKKFKGTAFIEVADNKALGAALSRHHTLLLNRRINVELTAGGGGKKSVERCKKIETLRQKQSAMQIEKAKALLEKHVASEESPLTADDVDDRMIDFLSWFDYETAKKGIEEYNRCVHDDVMNRKAFFMGILKRFRETDGVE